MAGNVVERVDDWVRIRHILISVSDKSGLNTLIPGLIQANPELRLLATGGTFRAIARILGHRGTARHLTQVADYTGQPETQGGLVKTLDFKIYLSLLTETYNASHQADMARSGAVPIDMVIANLYPFRSTVADPDTTVEEARANIDIGGPCMIRAAAKNYLRVAAVVDPTDYPDLVTSLLAHEGRLSLARRFALAQKAFTHTAAYDRAIRDYLAEQEPPATASAYRVE